MPVYWLVDDRDESRYTIDFGEFHDKPCMYILKDGKKKAAVLMQKADYEYMAAWIEENRPKDVKE